MDFESLEDVHSILNDVDRRRSTADFNLIFLERDKNLLDIKTCLESVYKEGPDSERARARQLVNQSIQSSVGVIQDIVQRSLHEGATYTVIQKSLPSLSKSKLPSARLLEQRSPPYLLCHKKSEQQLDTKRKCIDVKNGRSKLPSHVVVTAVPAIQSDANDLKALSEMPWSSFSVFPKISTKSILTKKTLKAQHAHSISKMQGSDLKFIPLGLKLQKKSIVSILKATNRGESENFHVQAIHHSSSWNTSKMKTPKNFQIQVLPSINIDSVNVLLDKRPWTNAHYIDLVNLEPHGTPSKVPDRETEEAVEQLTNHIVEDELLEYVLERLTLKEDISVTDMSDESKANGDAIQVMHASETQDHAYSPSLTHESISQALSESLPEDGILIPTPVPTVSSGSSSLLPMVITLVPTPPQEPITGFTSAVVDHERDSIIETSEHNSSKEQKIASTPCCSSSSSSLSGDIPEMLPTPLPTVEDPTTPVEHQSPSHAQRRPGIALVENFSLQTNSVVESDIVTKTEDEITNYSLGQARPAVHHTLMQSQHVFIPASNIVPNDVAMEGGSFDYLDSELDKTDPTTSTSMSEGEVRPYLVRWKSASALHYIDRQNSSAYCFAGAGNGKLQIHKLPKSLPARSQTGNSDISIGEITFSPHSLEKHGFISCLQDFTNVTQSKMSCSATVNYAPYKQGALRQESWSDGEIEPVRHQEPFEKSTNEAI